MNLEQSFDLNAGRLVLNFVNTVDERPGYDTSAPAPPKELLNSPMDFLKWCSLVEIVAPRLLNRLKQNWELHPNLSSKEFKRLINLRELLFCSLYSQISNGLIKSEFLIRINGLLENLPAQSLVKCSSGYKLTWSESLDAYEMIYAILLNDLIDLLANEDLSRLRVCAAKDCGWLFLDRSKNGKRRWCDMADCGNREKQRLFQARK